MKYQNKILALLSFLAVGLVIIIALNFRGIKERADIRETQKVMRNNQEMIMKKLGIFKK